jgi:hypothetical protein
MKIDYNHRQIGWVMLGVAAATMVVIAAPLVLTAPRNTAILLPLLFVFSIMAIVTILFSSMTVQLDEDVLRWHFGPSFWRNRLALAEIQEATAIKTKWYWGYGIKFFGPRRWLYNVSGTDAVELKLRDGGWVRLGTDDVAGLIQALRSRGL